MRRTPWRVGGSNLNTTPSTKNRTIAGNSIFLAPLSLKLIALVAVCSALYLAKSFFLPVLLAVITALTLGPLVSAAQRLRIPASVAALVLLVICGTGLLAGTLTLAGPFSEFVSNAHRIGPQLQETLQSLREPMESINSVGEEVEKIAEPANSGPKNEVVIKGPGLVSRAADDVFAIVAMIVLTLVLSFFLLVSRDMFFRKAIRIFPLLSDKKRILTLIKEVEHDVSRYLLTVAIINSCLGICVGVAFHLLGVPTPYLWGVAAALLNFLPYIGALTGILLSFGVSLITFETLPEAVLPAAAYLVLTAAEGQFVTPVVLGRRFSLNTVAILVSIAFWGFMWGPLGVLIAVPMLIIVKALSERVQSLASIGEFLSGERPPPDADDETDATAGSATVG